MKILITGILGLQQKRLEQLLNSNNMSIIGIDNLSRNGSEGSIISLRHLGAKIFRGDIRCLLMWIPSCSRLGD